MNKYVKVHLPLTALLISDEKYSTNKLKSLLIPTQAIKKAKTVKNNNKPELKTQKTPEILKTDEILFINALKDSPEILTGKLTLENLTDEDITNLSISGACGCFMDLPETKNISIAKNSVKQEPISKSNII